MFSVQAEKKQAVKTLSQQETASAAQSRTQSRKSKKSKKPASLEALVIQWEVSHSRNTDQISLIFREDSVELVANTSSWQKEGAVRLGRFNSPVTSKLEEWREQAAQYYIQWTQTVPVSSVLSLPDLPEERPDPHAPILRLGGEEIPQGHSYFEPLSRMIHEVWSQPWECMECAVYTRQGQSIVRTLNTPYGVLVRKDGSKAENTEEDLKNLTQQVFSKKQMSCVNKSDDRVECVDPQFGIFEI